MAAAVRIRSRMAWTPSLMVCRPSASANDCSRVRRLAPGRRASPSPGGSAGIGRSRKHIWGTEPSPSREHVRTPKPDDRFRECVCEETHR